jgi:hypothetical protein
MAGANWLHTQPGRACGVSTQKTYPSTSYCVTLLASQHQRHRRLHAKAGLTWILGPARCAPAARPSHLQLEHQR